MNDDSTFRSSADTGPSALLSAGLHRYIARTLRVSAHHLPWDIAQQLHADHQRAASEDALPSSLAGLRIVEIDDYCWRVDVTQDNIAATLALGWDALRRLLRLAQTYQCEALELAGDNPVLPAALSFEVFPWP